MGRVIDLHTHSTASDGTDPPAELVGRAVAAGIDVLAVTDHDTTAGWSEALAARPPGMTLLLGAEFSCAYHHPDGRRISLHLLGYSFDADHPGLREERARLRAGRLTRGRRIVENLVADGVPITWRRVAEIAAGGPVGRPHIGRALVESGVVPDVATAFTDLLSPRRPYYVPKPDTDVFDALELVRSAGGLPVFAHPLARRRGPVVDAAAVAAMAAAGLVGIEVAHPDHDADDRAEAAELARELGLVATGSSDYHGRNKSTGLAACTTSEQSWERLAAMPAAVPPVS